MAALRTSFEHTLDIEAPPQVLWAMTLDVQSWPTITPTMTSVNRLDNGPLRVGSKARIVQPRQAPRIWTVTRLDEGAGWSGGRVFTWQTKVATTIIEATHQVREIHGGCRNTLMLKLSGPGAALLGAIGGASMEQAITTENESFAAAATARALS